MRRHYYEKLADRYRKLHFWFNMAIAIGSLLAALTFFIDLPKLVSAALFCLVSGGVVWATFANYARKAASAETALVSLDVDDELNLQCAKVANEHLEAGFAR